MNCWRSEGGGGGREAGGDKCQAMVIVRPSSSLTELPGFGEGGGNVY